MHVCLNQTALSLHAPLRAVLPADSRRFSDFADLDRLRRPGCEPGKHAEAQPLAGASHSCLVCFFPVDQTGASEEIEYDQLGTGRNLSYAVGQKIVFLLHVEKISIFDFQDFSAGRRRRRSTRRVPKRFFQARN